MTIKEARRLTVGDCVASELHTGTVIGIKADSARIQWKNGPAVDIPHSEMWGIRKIERSEW